MVNSSKRRLLLLVLTVVLSVQLLWPYSSSPQQIAIRQPPSDAISIVSPADGTVVHPGDTIHIEVSVPSSRSVRAMMILSPLGGSEQMREAPPWSFTLKIPVDDRSISGGGSLLGKHPIYASAASPGRDAGSEAVIGVDVEMPDLPKKLGSQDSIIFLETLGEEYRWPLVIGTFSDGKELDLNESCCLTFITSDSSVVTVTDDQTLKAVRPGQAIVTAIYKQGENSVQLPIPVTFENYVLDATPSSLDFGEQPVGAPSGPLALTLKNLSHSKIQIATPLVNGDFSETDNCALLSPLSEDGGSCIINVVFKPTAKGSRSGKLDISYGSIIPTSIFLSGVGK
jgi:hypothetical protein